MFIPHIIHRKQIDQLYLRRQYLILYMGWTFRYTVAGLLKISPTTFQAK